jgi:hypothetical protein
MPYLYTYTNSETGVRYEISTAQNEQEFPDVGELPAALQKHTGATALNKRKHSPELLRAESPFLATIRAQSVDGARSVVAHGYLCNSLTFIDCEWSSVYVSELAHNSKTWETVLFPNEIAIRAILNLQKELPTGVFSLCLEVLNIWNQWQVNIASPLAVDLFQREQALEEFRTAPHLARHRPVGGGRL